MRPLRGAGVRRQAADMDHAASPTIAQQRQGGLGAMEGAVNAHRLGRAPIGVGQVGERRLAAYGGVVDEDIEPPEAFRDRRDHRVHIGTLGDVGRNQHGFAAARRDLVHHGLTLVSTRAYVDGHSGAGGGEGERDGASDVAPRAGDQRNLAFER